MSLTVVKVGGSLYDLPDLGVRLQRWLRTLDTPRVLLVPGGGAVVEVVRAFASLHRVGEEPAHWLALEGVAMNAHFLAALLPGAPVVTDPAEAPLGVSILDGLAFARADDARPDHLPHTWAATSDALAARAARVAGAARLVLLKSIAIPMAVDWDEAARCGWVDAAFADSALGLKVDVVNFRNES